MGPLLRVSIVSVRKLQRGRVIERKVHYGRKEGMLVCASTASREVSYAEFAKKKASTENGTLARALAVRFGQTIRPYPAPCPIRNTFPPRDTLDFIGPP